MKRITTIIVALFCVMASAYCQAGAFKFGKPEPSDVSMTVYPDDPDAPAVILYQSTEVSFNINANGSFIQRRNFVRRVKILKEDGLSWADDNLFLYNNLDSKTYLSKLEAYSYNMRDGKMVKTKMGNDLVFREKVDEYNTRVKWTVPDVVVGSVVEYRWITESTLPHIIQTTYFSYSIPARHIEAKFEIPEYFVLAPRTSGLYPLDIQQSQSIGSINLGGTPLSFTLHKTFVQADNVAGTKKEPMVWNSNRFRPRLDFELLRVDIPGSKVRMFSSSWNDVYTNLGRSEFGERTRMGNPLKNECEDVLKDCTTDEQRIRALKNILNSKVAWDGEFKLLGGMPRQALRDGKGDSAQMNFLLMSMLKDAGYKVVPMLLTPRHMSTMSRLWPTLEQISSFILKVYLSDDTKYYYVDATNPDSDLNAMPSVLLVDQAVEYRTSQEPVNIVDVCSGTTRLNVRMKIGGNSETAVVEVSGKHGKQNAMDIAEGSSLMPSYETEIPKENIKKTPGEIAFTAVFDQDLEASQDRLYIPATIIPSPFSNPFTAESRTYPIQFNHPDNYVLIASVEIPEGYAIEEMPKNIRLQACGNKLQCQFLTNRIGNAIQISFNMKIMESSFDMSNYEQIKEFFAHMQDMFDSMIVLKKA